MNSWEQLAIERAEKYGVPPEVVLSTIKAETGGRNVAGGSTGNAIGYGQVYLKWWYKELQEVAKNYGITLPGNTPILKSGSGYVFDSQSEDLIKGKILSDDRLSLDWAVRVIKSVWDSSGGDYTTFVKKYVGPAVDVSEIQRRTMYLEQYKNSSAFVNVPSENIDFNSLLGNVDTKIALLVGVLVLGIYSLINNN